MHSYNLANTMEFKCETSKSVAEPFYVTSVVESICMAALYLDNGFCYHCSPMANESTFTLVSAFSSLILFHQWVPLSYAKLNDL